MRRRIGLAHAKCDRAGARRGPCRLRTRESDVSIPVNDSLAGDTRHTPPPLPPLLLPQAILALSFQLVLVPAAAQLRRARLHSRRVALVVRQRRYPPHTRPRTPPFAIALALALPSSSIKRWYLHRRRAPNLDRRARARAPARAHARPAIRAPTRPAVRTEALTRTALRRRGRPAIPQHECVVYPPPVVPHPPLQPLHHLSPPPIPATQTGALQRAKQKPIRGDADKRAPVLPDSMVRKTAAEPGWERPAGS